MDSLSTLNAWLLASALLAPAVTGLLLLAGRVLPRSWISGLAFLGFTLPAAVVLWFLLPASGPLDALLQLRVDGLWLFKVGLNGISAPLFAMTAVVGFAAGLKALAQDVEARATYLGLILFMFAGTLAVFASDNIIGFYFFHEFALIPTFILTLFWGGEGRRSAAMQMAIYLTVGAMLSLGGILIAMQVAGLGWSDATFAALFQGLFAADAPLPAATGALTLFGLGTLASLFPFHSWAAPGYSAAPTPVSMLHAGALKKFGLYGIVIIAAASMRIGHGTLGQWFFWCALANLVVVGLICLAQRDLKQLLSWSSVAHMGPIFLGLWVGTAKGEPAGIDAALFLMVAHGLSCAALFLLANAVRTRTGTYRFEELGGLAARTPVLAAFFVAATMASIGLPGFGNFWGEVGVFLSLRAEPLWVQALVASTVVISAVYGLRAVAAVFFGPESKAIAERAAHAPFGDLGFTDRLAAAALLGASLTIGFVPSLVTRCTNRDAVGIAMAASRPTAPRTAEPASPNVAPKPVTPAPSAR
jgi:NADH-quinone oxidoreductase subunit M